MEDEEVSWYEPPRKSSLFPVGHELIPYTVYEGAREVPPITPEATVQSAREFGLLSHPIGELSEPNEDNVQHIHVGPDVRMYTLQTASQASVPTIPIPAPAPDVSALLSRLSSSVLPVQQSVQQQPAYNYGYDYNSYNQQSQQPQAPHQNAYSYNTYQQAVPANAWSGSVNHYPQHGNAAPSLTPYPGQGGGGSNLTYDEIVRSGHGRNNKRSGWGKRTR
jgi:hypothetical protein